MADSSLIKRNQTFIINGVDITEFLSSPVTLDEPTDLYNTDVSFSGLVHVENTENIMKVLNFSVLTGSQGYRHLRDLFKNKSDITGSVIKGLAVSGQDGTTFETINLTAGKIVNFFSPTPTTLKGEVEGTQTICKINCRFI